MKKEFRIIDKFKNKILKGNKLSFKEALSLISISNRFLPYLVAAANAIKLKFNANKIILCGIVNAKSGKCSENCSFCAQSGHYKTKVKVFPLKSIQELFKAAKQSKALGGNCFSIVTSGKGIVEKQDFLEIKKAVGKIKKININRCASLGILSVQQAKELKKAGLNKYHHNIETAKSYFQKICTTHSYAERLSTIRNAQKAGLKVCSGGIIGLGESAKQRVEMAFTLRALDVDSVPLNILNAIPGTKAARLQTKISPLEILKTIAVFRFILPNKIIGVFGGREVNLRNLQSMIFWAGANSMLIGNYLTTTGQPIAADLQMLADLELVKSK